MQKNIVKVNTENYPGLTIENVYLESNRLDLTISLFKDTYSRSFGVINVAKKFYAHGGYGVSIKQIELTYTQAESMIEGAKNADSLKEAYKQVSKCYMYYNLFEDVL
jgi:hypothetical protein